VETALPAKITRGSTTWEGTVVTLSVDGAGIRVSDDFPPVAADDAVISLTTSIAALQLYGAVHTRPATPAERRPSDAQLIIRFREPNQTETAVFASLIAAAHERSLTFMLDVRIPVGSAPQEAAPGALDLGADRPIRPCRDRTSAGARVMAVGTGHEPQPFRSLYAGPGEA
jgi:hypothetical protein